MKDEEFQKNLEPILITLYDIDQEVEKYLDDKKPTMKKEYYKNKPFNVDNPILDNKY